MKTVGRKEASRIWQQFLDHTKKEVFKVEVLQDYYSEDVGASLDAWLAGDKDKSIKLIKQESGNGWQRSYRARPIDKVRVHIVEYPLTPYLEWEIQTYKLSSIPFAGERVYSVDKSKLKDITIPEGDFWIFDDERVVQYRYRDTRAYEADIYDRGDDISSFLALKKRLLEVASPV